MDEAAEEKINYPEYPEIEEDDGNILDDDGDEILPEEDADEINFDEEE